MATLQKFKLLATQCGVPQSPTRSPRTSPIVHIRRRKTTLRMLLCRSGSRRSPSAWHCLLPSQPRVIKEAPEDDKTKKKELAGRTLKDLFGSLEEDKGGAELEEKIANEGKKDDPALDGPGSPRPGWGMSFRYRALLRRAWRPMLVTIPEIE